MSPGPLSGQPGARPLSPWVRVDSSPSTGLGGGGGTGSRGNRDPGGLWAEPWRPPLGSRAKLCRPRDVSVAFQIRVPGEGSPGSLDPL